MVGKEKSGAESKDKCGILKESAAKKVLRLIIQQSTKIDIYKIKNTCEKIVMCDGSILEHNIFSYGGFSNMLLCYRRIRSSKSKISGTRSASLDKISSSNSRHRVVSSQGNKYIMVLYKKNGNHILVKK